jgi:hypothetical protein
MSYPKLPEPKAVGFKSDEIAFVIPEDFPEYADTHMMCIVKHKGSLQVRKYFITVEAFSTIMENFTA